MGCTRIFFAFLRFYLFLLFYDFCFLFLLFCDFNSFLPLVKCRFACVMTCCSDHSNWGVKYLGVCLFRSLKMGRNFVFGCFIFFFFFHANSDMTSNP